MRPCKAQGSPLVRVLGFVVYCDYPALRVTNLNSTYMNLLTDLRRTGRTTRMIKNAGSAALDGHAVYIICATARDIPHFERLVVDLGYDGLGIKVGSPSDLSNFDWETMTLRGAHPNCKVFVDHYAIEIRFSRMLAELHRYDAEPSS